MKKIMIIISVLSLLLCANSCQVSSVDDSQHSEGTPGFTEYATNPNDNHSTSLDGDVQYVPPEGDDGIGDQWESLNEFKVYAAETKEDRDYPIDMNIANDNDLIPVPSKRDYASEMPFIFRVLEMYNELFARSWIWFYTQGEKGLIIIKVGKLTDEEAALSQTMTCAELLHEISPILVQPGDEVEVFSKIYERNITVAGDHTTSFMICDLRETEGKIMYFVYGEYLIRIADKGGTVDDEWLQNLDFYMIPYIE